MESKSLKGVLRDNLIWICALTFGLLVIGEYLGFATSAIPFPFFGKGFAETFDMYMSFWGIWAVFLIFLLLKKKSRYILSSLTYDKRGNTVKMLMFGFLAGFLLNGACALIAFLHGDFQLHFYKFEILPLIILFIAVFIQSSAEEVVCRAFLYQRILKRYNSEALAIGVNSAFFATLHLGNNGISVSGMLDLFITGLFFSMFVYCFRSVWMAMACHTTWNFTQNILLGLPNSGNMAGYSIFMMNNGSAHNSFAFDKEFGIEGTIVAITAMTLGFAVLYLWSKRRGRARTEEEAC